MKCIASLVVLPVLYLISAAHVQADGLFTYSGGVFTTINVPAVYSSSSFGGINDSGQIVGTYDNTYKLLGLLYSGGTFTTFSYPNGSDFYGVTIGQGINDAGQISGTLGPLGTSGYIYQSGLFTLITAPSAGFAGTNVTGIDNNGQVVGDFANFSNQYFMFIDDHGAFTTISAPIALGVPNALNDAGQIVGAPTSPGNGFEYSNGAFTTIAFPGASSTTSQASTLRLLGNLRGVYQTARQ